MVSDTTQLISHLNANPLVHCGKKFTSAIRSTVPPTTVPLVTNNRKTVGTYNVAGHTCNLYRVEKMYLLKSPFEQAFIWLNN